MCGHFSCTAWSPLHEVPLQLLCPTQAALQRLRRHFSTQVKTIQEKERGGWMEGPAQPGRAVLELSLRVLSLKFCCKHLCPPWCNVCCVCALLWPCSCPCCWSAPTGGKGALPSPVEDLSVLVCVGSWHGSDVAGRKKRWLSVCTRGNCCFREGLRSVVEWFVCF